MRYLIFAVSLSVIMSGCSGSEASTLPGEQSMELSAAPQPVVRGTVVRDSVFELGWPNAGVPQACISIPANAVLEGTEVSIAFVTGSPYAADHPRRFRKAQEAQQYRVLPPIFEISADPDFLIEAESNYFTVGICAQFPSKKPPRDARVAHNDPNSSDGLELLTPVSPCELRCTGHRAGASTGVWDLFAGSLVTPTPLHARPEEGGIGGRGGSLSPFGVVAGW